MKKKFSFLSKLGVSAAAVALVGGGLAWAQANSNQHVGQEQVWTMLTSNHTLAADDEVAIVKLSDDLTGTSYNGTAAGQSFSSASGIYGFTAVTNGSKFNLKDGDGNYLSSTVGSLTDNATLDEAQWTQEDGYKLKDGGLGKKFGFYNNAFFTATSADAHVYVVKDYVNYPSIYDNDAVVYEDQKVLRYNPAEGASQSTITISAVQQSGAASGQNERLAYRVKKGETQGDWQYTDIATLTATVTLDAECADKNVTIEAKTQVMNGNDEDAYVLSETSTKSNTYSVVSLAAPTLSAVNGTLTTENTTTNFTRDNKEKAIIAGTTATADAVTTIKLSNASDYAANVDLTTSTNDQSYTLDVKTTKNGATVTAQYAVTLKSYFSTEESTALANAAITATLDGTSAAIDGTVRAAGGQTVVMTFSKPEGNKYTDFKLYNSNAQPKVKVYTADTESALASATAEEVKATLSSDDNTVTVVLPATIPAHKYIKLSTDGEGYYFAVMDNTTAKNTVNCGAKTVEFKPEYDTRSFSCTTSSSTYNTDNVPTEFRYKLQVDANKTAAKIARENLMPIVQVCNAQGTALETQPSITYDDATSEFVLTFASKLPAGSYNVVFPQGSLKGTYNGTVYTNNSKIRPSITVSQAVRYSYIIANSSAATSQPAKICVDKDMYLIVNANMGDESRTVTLNTDATQTKASITTTSGTAATCDLTLTKYAANRYKITGITDAFKNSFATSANYKVTIPTGLFTADNSDCPGEDQAIKVGDGTTQPQIWRDVTYSVENNAEDNTVVVDNKKTSFSFDLKAVIGTRNYQSIKTAEGVTLPVTIQPASGTAIDATMTIAEMNSTTGISVATVSANDNTKGDEEDAPTDFAKLKGAYTVTIPAGTFTLCGCESAAMTVYVEFGTPKFTFEAGDEFITDVTKKMVLETYYEVLLSESGGSYKYSYKAYPTLANGTGAVKVYDNSGNLAATGNLTAIDATAGTYSVSLSNTLAAGEYTVKVVKDAFTTGATKNEESTGYTLTVKPNVTYTYEGVTNVVGGQKSFDITVVLNANPIEIASANITADASKFSVAGSDITVSSVYAKGTSNNYGTAASKKCTFTVTLSEAPVKGDYNLNIAEGAFTASTGTSPVVTYNSNAENYVPFTVESKVDFEAIELADADKNILPSDVAVTKTISMKAYNDDDHDVSRTDEVEANLNGWQIAKTKEENGSDVNSPTWQGLTIANAMTEDDEPAVIPGSYTFSNAFTEAGTYTVKAPADAFSVGASKSSAALEWTILVQGKPTWASSAIEKTVGSSTKVFTLAMSDLESTSYALNSADKLKIKASYMPKDATEATEIEISNATVNAAGSLVITLADEFPANDNLSTDAYSQWKIELGEGAVKAGLASLNKTITVNVTVKPDFIFQDYDTTVEPAATTAYSAITGLSSDNKTCDKITWRRYNNDMTIQAMAVPFTFENTEAVQNAMTIYKLDAVVETAENTYSFYYKTVDEGATIYANKPYIMKPKAETSINITVPGTLVDPTSYSGCSDDNTDFVECATTSAKFDFMSTCESTVLTGFGNNVKYLRLRALAGGAKGFANANGATMLPWAWYIKVDGKDVNYSKVFIDDEPVSGDEATAIMNVMSNSDVNDATIYSIGGTRQNTVRKGTINIVNGKKIVVK